MFYLRKKSKLKIVLALAGPDGVGKSTTIDELKNLVSILFTSIEVRNWRPGWLPALGEIIGNTNQTEYVSDSLIIPRNEAGSLQFIRQFYYFLDFTLGSKIKDRNNPSAMKLVIYDRSYYDIFVHPERFGFSLKSYTWYFEKFIPRYDAIVLLSDTAERIYARKKELDKETIQDQLYKWEKLVKKGKINYVIRVDKPAKKIAKYCNRYLLFPE